MKECFICGDLTNRRIAELFYHFRPISFRHAKTAHMYFRGNSQLYGSYLQGALSVIRLASPLLALLSSWKYRKCRLILPLGAEVTTTYDNEEELK